MDIITQTKYSGLFKLVSSFCKHFEHLHETDIDSFILFITIIFGYTCKHLKNNNQDINEHTVYNFIEQLWENTETRGKIIQLYTDTVQKRIT
jgi:hypothetical protein